MSAALSPATAATWAMPNFVSVAMRRNRWSGAARSSPGRLRAVRHLPSRLGTPNLPVSGYCVLPVIRALLAGLAQISAQFFPSLYSIGKGVD